MKNVLPPFHIAQNSPHLEVTTMDPGPSLKNHSHWAPLLPKRPQSAEAASVLYVCVSDYTVGESALCEAHNEAFMDSVAVETSYFYWAGAVKGKGVVPGFTCSCILTLLLPIQTVELGHGPDSTRLHLPLNRNKRRSCPCPRRFCVILATKRVVRQRIISSSTA